MRNPFKKDTSSLKRMLGKAVLTSVTSVGALGLGFVAMGGSTTSLVFPESPEAPQVRQAESRVQALVERHDCWVGKAPADMEGQIPGHAVVTYTGDPGPVYEGGLTVDLALRQVFEGKEQGLEVHAFCR